MQAVCEGVPWGVNPGTREGREQKMQKKAQGQPQLQPGIAPELEWPPELRSGAEMMGIYTQASSVTERGWECGHFRKGSAGAG